jgi:acid phosphatase (class A)
MRSDASRIWRRSVITVLIAAAAIAPYYRAQGQSYSAPVPEARPGFPKGYLSQDELPNSRDLLPPPPRPGSAASALDEEVSRRTFALRNTPRWRLAADDADLRFPSAAGVFSCALGAPITEQNTPALYRLLQRSRADAALATYAAKSHYHRDRPFVENKAPLCDPRDRSALMKNGSYPSGHAAVGWAWALILAEIAPDRIDAIIARGRAFGESRVVCNVHWESDVIAGRFVGTVVVARLHADPAFLADLNAARSELAAVRAGGVAPVGNCAAQSAAMALQAPIAP